MQKEASVSDDKYQEVVNDDEIFEESIALQITKNLDELKSLPRTRATKRKRESLEQSNSTLVRVDRQLQKLANLVQQDDEAISSDSNAEYDVSSSRIEKEKQSLQNSRTPIRTTHSPSAKQQTLQKAQVNQALSTPPAPPHHNTVVTSPFTLRAESQSNRYRIAFVIRTPPLVHLLSPSPTYRLAAAAQANPSPVSKTALAHLSHVQSPSRTVIGPVYIPPLSPAHFYMPPQSSDKEDKEIRIQSSQSTYDNLTMQIQPETKQPLITSTSHVSLQQDRDTSPHETKDTTPFFLKHAPPATIQILRMYTRIYEKLNYLLHSSAVTTSQQTVLTKDSDSETESASEFDPDELSDQSSEDLLGYDKRKQRYIRGIQKNKVCAELQRIYQGDYSVYNTPEGETIVYGDYPILQGVFIFYGSRSKLFEIIQTLFPDKPIPFSSLMRRMTNIRYPQNRTDLCPICFRHDEYLQMKSRHPQHLFWASPTYQTYEKAYNAHEKLLLNQRSAVLAQIKSLTDKESVIIGDYKENILLPIELNQICSSFYTRFQVTCLTFVCYRKVNTEISKLVVTFLSNYLNHHATFTLHCFNQLLQLKWFSELKNLSVWTDGGKHFRSLEYLRGVLDSQTSEGTIPNCSVNYFAPYHGKSEVDAVFGLFAHILKHPDRERIACLEDLYECLQSECLRFTHSSKYSSASYMFIKFVYLHFLFTCTYLGQMVQKKNLKWTLSI